MFSCAIIKYLLAPYSGLSLELLLPRYILGGCTLRIFVRFLFFTDLKKPKSGCPDLDDLSKSVTYKS